MKLICESCQTRGKNKVFKIKCRSCGETIMVKGTDPDAPAPGPEADDEDAATTIAPAPSGMATEADESGSESDGGWYVVVAGEQVGPLAKAAVLQHLAEGAIDDSSFVWRQGFDDWKKLSDVETFRHLVSAAPRAAEATGDDDATMMDDQLPDTVRALIEAEKESRASAASMGDEGDEPTMALAMDDELAMTRMVPTGVLESESASRAEAQQPAVETSASQPQRTSTGQMKARSL